ncbi:2,3-diphosphoglycerate-dependent phosphoglycerate mutase [Candidatus Woesearchaeota archaeon]|nr:2,3-diphosphoglycerate-dependent phosphoglycerate mutase [Candidatus Woesearchaeota archaeon]
MIKLVLIRHGESKWNKANKFTGWTDVTLSEKGKKEAKEAGKILKKKGYEFDIAFDSFLKRSHQTRKIVLKVMGLEGKISVKKSWRLNERHYGALQGLNKAKTAERVGEKQVHLWRRGYGVRPPALDKDDKRWPGNQARYKDIPKKYLPLTESLKDTVKRVVPYWKKEIVPELKKGKKVVIFAHGNSLRALVKYLDKIPDKEIPHLNIPTGIPLVYELDEKLKPKKHYYLGDREKIKKAQKKVKKQGKAK